jgi:hypothetical protein
MTEHHDAPRVKRGVETTEFLMSMAALIVGAVLTLKSEDAEARELGRQLMLVAVAAYPVSRGMAKIGGER